MIAADSLALLERNAQLHRRILALAGILATAAILLLTGYCTGGRRTRTGLAIAAIHAKQDTIRDTIRVVEQRLVVDTQRVRVTADGATVARAAFDSAEHAVLAIADTSSVLPDSIVLPALHVCDQALARDSIAYVALAANLTDMTIDRNAQRDRADGDEAEMKILKPPKFGFKSGLATGLALMIGLAHFVR